MVYLVQMAQSLSEKGAGKRLLYCEMLVDMVKEVAKHHNHEELYVLYCEDGAGGVVDMNTCVNSALQSNS